MRRGDSRLILSFGHIAAYPRTSRVTKLLDEKDVLRLLREDVDKAGGQSAWARQTGVDRVHLNKVLRGKRPLTRTILQALKLKKVYTATPAAQMKTRRGPA